MQVSSINRGNYYNPSCKGFERTVYKKALSPDGVYRSCGEVKHKNTSWLYRPTFELCTQMYNYFQHVFKNVNKVNVYNYGCSLGYDSYSYILWLLSGKKKNPEKFLPIIAKDYDEDIIELAGKNQLMLDDWELYAVRTVAKEGQVDKYIDLTPNTRLCLFGKGYCATLADLKPALTDNVKFTVADIRTDYKNIEPQNSIVMAQNFWPYMEKEDRYELAENLYKQLDKGSLVRIDTFDNNEKYLKDNKSTASLLYDAGFKTTPFKDLVFKK